jgi:hypothetical protein
MTTRQDFIDEAQRLVDTLKARGKTHGQGDQNFVAMAAMLNLCGYRRATTDGREITPHQLDSLDAVVIYIVSKLARIAAGDRTEPDHYIDTAGYGVIGAAIARSLKEAPRD